MKNKNSTRRAFGRRALAFGIAMFAMVTLTAVGFAAWLISSNATAEGDGGIKTEAVTQANIKIEIKNVNDKGELVANSETGEKYDIVFSLPKDASGLVTFQNNGGKDKGEQLGFAFVGSVEHWERVGSLKFSIRVPEIIVKAAGLTKSGDAWSYSANDAYIALPEYAMDKDGNALPKVVGGSWDDSSMTAPVEFKNISDLAEVDLTKTLVNGKIAITKPTPTSETTATFAGTGLQFGWGARYNHVNPAITFNSADWTNITKTGIELKKDTNGNYESYIPNQVALELLKLQATVNGVDLNGYITSAGITLGDKTIDEYVKGAADSQAVATQLATVQQKMADVIYAEGFSRPTYKLYIEAIVR